MAELGPHAANSKALILQALKDMLNCKFMNSPFVVRGTIHVHKAAYKSQSLQNPSLKHMCNVIHISSPLSERVYGVVASALVRLG